MGKQDRLRTSLSATQSHRLLIGITCDTPVRAFGTFTQDLHGLADWFKSLGVTSVAMGSTGVYWIPAFEFLEGRGFHLFRRL